MPYHYALSLYLRWQTHDEVLLQILVMQKEREGRWRMVKEWEYQQQVTLFRSLIFAFRRNTYDFDIPLSNLPLHLHIRTKSTLKGPS